MTRRFRWRARARIWRALSAISRSHRSGDNEDIDLADQETQDIELGRHLRPADQRQNGRRRLLEGRRQGREFGLHQLPGGIWQQPSQRVDRGVRAVRGGEGIIDVDIAQIGERAREIERVRFLLLVEAKIFEESHLPWPKRRDDALCFCTDAILGEDHIPAANRPA